MSFLSDEGSTEGSQPREGIEIQAGPIMHRIATGTRNITINGQLFKAYPSAREELKLAASNDETDLIIQIPLKHPAVQRYLANGIPPKSVFVKVWRLQLTSGEFETIWRGYLTSIAAQGEVAMLRVPSQLGEMMQRKLPTITVGRACPHILYDSNCKAPREYWFIATTVTDVNGRVVTVASMAPITAAQWARYGELVHVQSGERMTIQDQVGTTITMQFPINELKYGDAVQVYAGCDHSIEMCRDKFTNVPNYGGLPKLPATNVFNISGFGVLTQE